MADKSRRIDISPRQLSQVFLCSYQPKLTRQMRDETIGICFALHACANEADRYMFTYQILSVSHVEGLTNISQMQNSE